jgi:nicotinamidase-related amidase
MSLTILDPRTALVVIDLQKGILALPTAHPIADVVRLAASLADAFRRHGLPFVLFNVDGGAPGRTEQARRLQDLPPGWTELAAVTLAVDAMTDMSLDAHTNSVTRIFPHRTASAL